MPGASCCRAAAALPRRDDRQCLDPRIGERAAAGGPYRRRDRQLPPAARQGVAVAPAAASLMVDMAISILSQLGFALLGLALLAWRGRDRLGGIALGMLGGVALAGGFILAQRADILSAPRPALNGVAAGRFSGDGGHSARIDRMTRRLWRVRGAIPAASSGARRLGGRRAGDLAGAVFPRPSRGPGGSPRDRGADPGRLLRRLPGARRARACRRPGSSASACCSACPPRSPRRSPSPGGCATSSSSLPGLLAWVWAERRLTRASPGLG